MLARTGGEPMAKRALRIVAGTLVLWAFIEGLSYLCLWATRRVIHITYSPAPIALGTDQKKSLRKFLAPAEHGGAPYARLDRNTSVTLDPSLGWVTASPDANAAGMRDDREYAPTPPGEVARFSAFGDSFVYGYEVPLAAAWPKQFAAMAPGVECLNYGVPAYGLDQAYLRYLKVGAEYHPHVVLIGFMSEDLFRSVNVFRPFYWDSGWLFTKPRFQLVNDQLTLLPNPLATPEAYQDFVQRDAEVLRRLGRDDYFYHASYFPSHLDISPSVRLGKIFAKEVTGRLQDPILNLDGTYNEESEAYRVTVRILTFFYAKVLANGAMPIVVVFPDAEDLARMRRGKPCTYEPLLKHLRQGYRYIDTQGAFSSGANGFFTGMAHSHFTAAGNAAVATYIWNRLQEWKLTGPAEIKAALAKDLHRK
jgi:hypothetical protein